MQIYSVNVKCPFGESFIADIEQNYEIDNGGVMLGETVCIGLWTIDNHLKLYHPFEAEAGLEYKLAEAIAEQCRKSLGVKITDACIDNARENRLLRCA